jgi:type II secretory pathway pseudopilin PulG
MAAASARPTLCMFNTQQELDLKYIYEPQLNKSLVQNTPFNWSLIPISPPINPDNLFKSNSTRFAKFFLAIGVGFMCVTTSAQVGVDPWKCDQNFYKTVPLSGKVQEAVIAEMRQTCPELGDPANLSVFAEATAYARQGVICFASIGEEIKKLKSGSTKHSQFFGPLKASPRCESYLVKEWGLNSIAEQGSTSRPLATTNSTNTQQQSQQAQQQAQQAQEAARVAQTRADQARQGKRRQHEPENEAHECLSLDRSPGFGGFVNKCNFKVSYSFCTYNPKKDSWAEAHDCVGRSGNSDFVGPGRTSAAHTKNTETVYWFACKDPAWSLDTEYVPGQGLRGRCYTVGGK